MTTTHAWPLLLAPERCFNGVYSGSMRTPIKRASFAPVDAFFADSDCYCAWQFVYEPRLRRWGAPGNPAPGNPAPGGPARGGPAPGGPAPGGPAPGIPIRSEEHTSELQSHSDLVCRLLLEKKKKDKNGT